MKGEEAGEEDAWSSRVGSRIEQQRGREWEERVKKKRTRRVTKE